MSRLIAFTCPACKQNLTASSEELDTRCVHCGTLIPLRWTSVSSVVKSKLPVPAQVSVRHGEDGLRMSYFWFNWRYLVLFLFSLCWSLFVCSFIASYMFPLVIIGHILAGIGLLYWSGLHLFNRTEVELTLNEVSVWFEPFPWFGEITIKTEEIQGLVCSKTAVQNRQSYNIPWYQEKPMFYEHHLYVFRKGSVREIVLLPYLPSKEASFFFKQEIEAWLSFTREQKTSR